MIKDYCSDHNYRLVTIIIIIIIVKEWRPPKNIIVIY